MSMFQKDEGFGGQHLIRSIVLMLNLHTFKQDRSVGALSLRWVEEIARSRVVEGRSALDRFLVYVRMLVFICMLSVSASSRVA